MRICIINNRYGKYSKGGAENVIKTKVNELTELGHRVSVITTKPYRDKIIKNSDENDSYFVSTLYYWFENQPKFFRAIWHVLDFINLKSYIKVKKIIKDINPELIITHNLKGLGYPIVLIPKKLKIKHSHVLHDIQLLHPSGLMLFKREKILESIFSKIYQAFGQAIFSNVKNVSSPSEWLLEIHKKYGFFKNSENKIEANPLTFKIMKNKHKIISEKLTFLFVGQIEIHKGLEILIEAFLNIQDQSNIELKIIGIGAELERLKNLYKESNNIIFVGKCTPAEVRDVMITSYCLVLPSLCYENSPTVLFESISCGLPVIASRLGGTIENIHKLGGILFDPADQNDLQLKMSWATKNPTKMAELSKRAFCRLSKKNRVN